MFRPAVVVLIPLLLGSRATAGDRVDFAHDVLPLLKARCAECHTAGKSKGGVSFNTRAALLKSKAVVPGQSGESLLIHAIRHEDGLAMPPKKPRLPEQTIADFERWINAGACACRLAISACT